MFGIGMQELIIIMVVALLVLGPSRLPQVARTLGKGMREFRRASDDLRSAMWVDLDDERGKPSMPPPASLPAPTPAQSTTERAITASGDVHAAREPSVLPAEIELAVEDSSIARSAAKFEMPRAAEGIVARGSSLQSTRTANEGAAETTLSVSPKPLEKSEQDVGQFKSGGSESA